MMYPETSKAIKHYKETEEGCDNVCKIVEDIAKEYAVDTVIKACVNFGQSLDETIKYVTSEFDVATKDYITSQYNALKSKPQRL